MTGLPVLPGPVRPGTALFFEFVVEPGPRAVFDQRRDVDSNPAGVQGVVFFLDNPFDAVSWCCGKAGREPVNDLADDGFLLCIAHRFIVGRAGLSVNQPCLHSAHMRPLPWARQDT